MSKSDKKKPGDMAAARERHLHRQAIQNAINAVREGNRPEITLPSGKWELGPVPEFFPAICLVRFGNQVVVGWVSDEEGIKMTTPSGAVVHVGSRILGQVWAQDDAAKAYC